jgi:hypothetical protein
MFVMQEVLSRTDDPKAPLLGQEFCELRPYDSVSAGEPVFFVREARAQWNASINDVDWDILRIEEFTTLQEAKDRYAARGHTPAEQGFIYSDSPFKLGTIQRISLLDGNATLEQLEPLR